MIGAAGSCGTGWDDVAVKYVSTSMSMTVAEMDMLDRTAAERKVSRSGLIRSALRPIIEPGNHDNDGEPDGSIHNQETDVNTRTFAVRLRNHIAGLLGIVSPPDTGYPAMSLDAYDLALTVSERHTEDVRAGSIPMVHDDAVAAGLNPDGRETWGLYMDVLPDFFGVLLGPDSHPLVDVRYETLDDVNGQGSGAIEGVVESCDDVYPDGDTMRYVEMDLRMPSQTVRVLVPRGSGADEVTPGLTVYVAGMFAIERRKIVMRARKCVVRRVPGFDEVYAVADRWGVPDVVASQAVLVLRECHTKNATRFSEPFAAYLAADHVTMPVGMNLMMPDGWPIKIFKSDLRAAPEGMDAFRWCATRWPSLARRIEAEKIRRISGPRS